MVSARTSSARRPLRILIAGGKTGGHLFPALAMAEEFGRRVPDVEILFAGTKGGLEERVLPDAGYPLALLKVRPLMGVGMVRRMLGVLSLPRGLVEALAVVRGFQPDLTIGVGSFVAGPIIVAAWILRRVCVIEDADSRPGLTNRASARFAARVYVGFENAAGYFSDEKVRVTGVPLRRAFVDMAESMRNSAPSSDEQFVVFVVGGSQGAHALNLCLLELLRQSSAVRETMYFIHQTGPDDEELARTTFEDTGASGEVHAFIENMVEMYARATVVVCRAGAVTLAELAVMGRPAILAPLPSAAADHQTANARALAECDAAIVAPQTELTPARLEAELVALRDNPERRQTLARNARAWARPNAAADIVDDCLALLAQRGIDAHDSGYRAGEGR